MKKNLLIFFLIFFTSNSLADNKVLYLDISFILNTSTAGKFLNNELNSINKKNLEEFKKIENSIKTQEDNLLKQKNILKEEEFNSKLKKACEEKNNRLCIGLDINPNIDSNDDKQYQQQ